jgi:hypothetical protein
LERMTALRIMEDHDRLLHSTGGGSGTVGVAARNRWALSAICFMVAMGLLLCTGRASLAQQQARVPDPAGPAAPHGLAGQGSEGIPVAQSRPAVPRAEQAVSREPANVGSAVRPAGGLAQPGPAEPSGTPRTERQPPASRPAPIPPAEPGTPVGREKPAVTPGRQEPPPPQKPAHVPPEHPQGPSQGAAGPTGQHPERPYPEKPVDRGLVTRPDQQPTPQPEVVHQPTDNPQVDPRGGEDTGRPEGKGSHVQPDESGVLPDEVDSHNPEDGGAGTQGQPAAHPGQDTGQEPDIGGGHPPTTAGNDSGVGRTGNGGMAANAPAGGPPPGTGVAQDPGQKAAAAALDGHEPHQGARSTEGTSPTPAKATADADAPSLTAVHGEGSVTSGSSRAVGSASPAAPPGGGRQSAGYRVRAASEAPFGSTEYFFSYLWEGGSYSVQQDGLGPMRNGARDFVAGTSHGGALTQRAPPLPLPSPFSGFGLTMGGAVSGASSSGEGYVPLLAVIFCCLSAVLWRGRYRAYGALLRAGTVPRLALERPG